MTTARSLFTVWASSDHDRLASRSKACADNQYNEDDYSRMFAIVQDDLQLAADEQERKSKPDASGVNAFLRYPPACRYRHKGLYRDDGQQHGSGYHRPLTVQILEYRGKK